MTTYHRYLVVDEKRTTLTQLRSALRDTDARVDLDGEVVLYDGQECGILIDVCDRESPIFADDLQVARDRMHRSKFTGSNVLRLLDGCSCIVTTQVLSNANDMVLEAIWSALRSCVPGILVLEDHAATIRYYD